MLVTAAAMVFVLVAIVTLDLTLTLTLILVQVVQVWRAVTADDLRLDHSRNGVCPGSSRHPRHHPHLHLNP